MGLTPFPHGLSSFGIPVIGAGPLMTTGKVYFLGNTHTNASDGNSGLDPDHPFNTLAYAVSKCRDAKGDVILVMEGHSEAITTCVDFTTSKDGIRVWGLGTGRLRPLFTIGANVDLIDLNGTNIELYNLRFTSSAANTGVITVGGADNWIHHCEFICAVNSLASILIEATGHRTLIEDNYFIVTINGPDHAIKFEGAADGVHICRNVFNGASKTNAWDSGTVLSGVKQTDCLVEGNRFIYIGTGIGGVEFSSAATGIIAHNLYAGGILGAMQDPGSCLCFENYEADAVDETGALEPGTAAG